MRWKLAVGMVIASLSGAANASADAPCFALFVDPAAAPVEPGEPAILFTAAGAESQNDFVIRLFDAEGTELPIAVEVDPSQQSFFVRSAQRIEPGSYFVEYTHECSGTTRMAVAFEASPPKPPDAPQPGDSKKGCDCRAVTAAPSSTAAAGWLAFGAIVVALRRRLR